MTRTLEHAAQDPFITATPQWWQRRSTLGIGLGLTAAVFYTAANICLRNVVDCDPMWVSGVKAMPTVVIAAPLVVSLVIRRSSLINSRSSFWQLTFVSIIVQVLGNGLFQWSLGILGLALAIPLTLGGVLVGSAVIGQWWLDERVSWNSAVGVLTLTLAVVVLSLGAGEAAQAMQTQQGNQPQSTFMILTGVVGFCFCGIAFSSLGAVIRHVAKQGMPLGTILITNGIAGVLVLCGIALANDQTIISDTEPIEWATMMAAGTFNALAFCALTVALKLIRLLYVNALNVTQMAMAAAAGVMIFAEPITAQLVIGTALTALGILVMGRNA